MQLIKRNETLSLEIWAHFNDEDGCYDLYQSEFDLDEDVAPVLHALTLKEAEKKAEKWFSDFSKP